MTTNEAIDEAITHCEEVAKEQDKLCKRYDDASGYTRNHNEDIRTTDAKKCAKCANEHRQLAEWLKDYKRLLEQKPCEDVISRQAVLDYIYNDLGLGDEENGKDIERQMELESSYGYVKSLPPVSPQPKTGHWIYTLEDWNKWECSECGFTKRTDVHVDLGYKYCPNCGAKMEG